MSLKEWLGEGKLRTHATTQREIQDLFNVVDRDLEDSRIAALSADRRFMTTYNSVLQLATIVLRAAGYRGSGVGHHWVTFQALPHLLGPEHQSLADYFNGCRSKRNTADYDAAGEISDGEVVELYQEALLFRTVVLRWLDMQHPALVPEGIRERL